MLSKTRITHLIRSAGILMAAFLANKVLALGQRIIIARQFGIKQNKSNSEYYHFLDFNI
jgi:hypothetical protein